MPKGERVIFAGLLRGADRVAALADADLFGLPSDHENFGISVVEALAAGTPVLITPGVPLASLVRKFDIGWVPEQDRTAIASAARHDYREPDHIPRKTA